MKISVLCPTRKNVESLKRSLDSILTNQSGNNQIDIQLGVDDDDGETISFLSQLPTDSPIKWHSFPRMGYEKIHLYFDYLARKAQGEYLFFINDDAYITSKNWDSYLEPYTEKFKVILPHITNIAVDGKVYEGFSFTLFIAPVKWLDVVGRFSLVRCADDWMEDVLKITGKNDDIKVFCSDIKLVHDRRNSSNKNRELVNYHSSEMKAERRKDANKLIEYFNKNSKYMNEDIFLDENWFSLEKENDKYFRWSEESSSIKIVTPLDKLIVYFEKNALCSNTLHVQTENTSADIPLENGINVIELSVQNSKKLQFFCIPFVPAEKLLGSVDTRQLGLKLVKIEIIKGNKTIPLEVDEVVTERCNELKKKFGFELVSTGRYGDACVNIISQNHNKNVKLNLKNQATFYHHRSGWNYVLRSLSEFNNENGYRFCGFLENDFSWNRKEYVKKGIIPFKENWVGFFHNPHNMPLWFCKNGAHINVITNLDEFQNSLNKCKGIFTLTKYLADYIQQIVKNVPVYSFYHPTEIPTIQFNYNEFIKNKEKKVVNIGWWLRRLTSIYKLKVDENIYKKETMRYGGELFVEFLGRIEKNIYNISISETEMGLVRNIPKLTDNEYDLYLSKNIVFVDLYDASANNVIIECIARGTPILINKLVPVVEYLGNDYPFYFNSLEEATVKLDDMDLIKETHRYLLNCDGREKITREYFTKQFSELNI
jgi:hypothetical protein